MRLGHPDQGVTDYGKAIDIRPDDGWSWLGRGLARKNLNRLEPALVDLTRGVALEPNVVSAWSMLGEILGTLKRWDEAASAFDRWSELGGDSNAIPWYFHAALRLYSGDKPGYRRACHAMLERFGKTRDPFVASLAAHACSLGVDSGVDASRIVELAEQASRHKPQDCWSLYTLAAALRRAGRLDTALARLEQAVRVNPEWTCTPLIAAVRELSDRALRVRTGDEGKSRRTQVDQSSSEMNSSKLREEIRKSKAAWQHQVEAVLLGRELDAGG